MGKKEQRCLLVVLSCFFCVVLSSGEVFRQQEEENYTLAVLHEPFAALEHVNLNMGGEWTEDLNVFFLEVMRCTLDPRALGVLSRTNEARLRLSRDARLMGELRWINIGLQQLHLPVNDQVVHGYGGEMTQKLRGEMVLAWPRDALSGLRERLSSFGAPILAASDSKIQFLGPNGMRFLVETDDDEESWIFGSTNGFKLGDDARDVPMGGPSEGLGIKALRFDVKANTAMRICDFYETIFHADVLRQGDFCSVLIGFRQALEFRETNVALPLYDGHHIALYVNYASFVDAYHRAQKLVFHNPRSPQFNFETLEAVLGHDEFRFKDITDLQTGEVLYELEHEIRALSHVGFPLKHRLPGGLQALLIQQENTQNNVILDTGLFDDNNNNDQPPAFPASPVVLLGVPK